MGISFNVSMHKLLIYYKMCDENIYPFPNFNFKSENG